MATYLIYLTLILLVVYSLKVDSNPDVIIKVRENEEEPIIWDYPENLYLNVQLPLRLTSNQHRHRIYNITLRKTNDSKINNVPLKYNTGLAHHQYAGSIYKADNGQGLLHVRKQPDLRYKLRGQLCTGSVKITIKGVIFGVGLRESKIGLHRVKMSKCQGKLSTKLENTPSYRFPHRNLVHVNHRNKRHVKRHPRRRRLKRASVESYTVELLIFVDYEAFAKWEKIFNEATNEATVERIKQYYSYIFNGIDLRFRSIENQPFEINMAFAGFNIAKTEEESFWTSTSTIEDQVINGQRLLINASEALDKFQVWLDDEATELPKYDHAILFTGGDLTYAGNTGNTGLAFAESMCRNISNSSIVEEAFDIRTITFATRQLARSLGARDDMDNNDCLEFFNFIMAPKFKLPVKSFTSNRWKFSTCTVQYFKDYITKINEDELNCLQETSLVERYPEETVVLIQELPGKVYTAKEQCENVLGTSSDICRARTKPSDYDKLCGGLLCTVPGTEDCNYILPADGTPCGNMKYCFEGQCLEFDDAEKGLDDICVFGDDPSGNCKSRIREKPFLCYTDNVRYTCCTSCAKVEIGLSGCEYGDRKMSCQPEDCVADNTSDIKTVCCRTCADGPVPTLPPIDDWFFDVTTGIQFSTTTTTREISSVSRSTEPVNVITTSSPLPETTYQQPSESPSTIEVKTTTDSSATISFETTVSGSEEPVARPETTTIIDTVSLVNKTPKSTSITPSSSDPFPSTSTSIATYTSKPYNDQTTDSTFKLTSTSSSIPTVGPTTPSLEQISLSTVSQIVSEIPKTNYSGKPKSELSSTVADKTVSTFVKPTYTSVYPTITVPVSDITDKTAKSKTQEKKQTVAIKVPCASGTTTITPAKPTAPPVTATTLPTIHCAKICKKLEQRRWFSGQRFTLYDRMFFKELARSMRQGQRKIRQQVQNSIKHLYTGVTRQIRRHQESDMESFIYNDVVNPHVEVPSQDDDDINRLLVPVWRRQHTILLRNVERDVKHMRYKVLMMVNRHLRKS